MKYFLIIAALIVGTALLMWAASAQAMGMCGPRDDFVKALNDKYQETGKALGIAGQVNVVELFTSKAGTWTVIVTTPSGKACIIAAGQNWQELPVKKSGDDL